MKTYRPFSPHQRLRQFLLRGIEKVRAEWSLTCLTHNLLKAHRAAT